MMSSSTASQPPAPPSRSLRSRLLLWARDILLFLVLAFVVSTVFGRLRAPDLPEQAPGFTLMTVDGERVSLADFKGRKVVLNFWATWCGPCRAEIPMVSSFAHSNPDITVLGVSVDGEAEALRAAGKKLGIDYPILVGTKEVVRAYGASTVPTTVFVNEDGSVDSAHVGLITAPQLWIATR